MPAGLYYPWHQHPAEEMYLCLAGEAVFKKDGAPDQHMGEGGVTLHVSTSHTPWKHWIILFCVTWFGAMNLPPNPF